MRGKQLGRKNVRRPSAEVDGGDACVGEVLGGPAYLGLSARTYGSNSDSFPAYEAKSQYRHFRTQKGMWT